MKSAEQLAEEAQGLYEAIAHPFPYSDLETLRRITQKNWTGLNPDIDTYQSAIAGYCSWGRKALRWTPERVRQVEKDMAKSFFERYPRYSPLKKVVTPRLTPKLYANFVHYELMRQTMLQLACLLEQAETTDTSMTETLMKVA